MVDVAWSPISSGARDTWQQQRCDSLHCHEKWWGDSGISTIFTRSKSLRLRPLRQSERTTATNPVHKWDEIISDIGQSIWNNNKDECTDGVRHLPNIWQKVIIKGETTLKVHKWGNFGNSIVSTLRVHIAYHVGYTCTLPPTHEIEMTLNVWLQTLQKIFLHK